MNNKIDVKGLRGNFSDIDEQGELPDTGGNRRSMKGKTVEDIAASKLDQVIAAKRGYRMTKMKKVILIPGDEPRNDQFVKPDRGIYNERNELVYALEMKDYGDSPQFRSVLPVARVMLKKFPTLKKYFFISMHAGSSSEIRQLFIDSEDLTDKVVAYNILPLTRRSDVPTYLDKFSDDDLQGYFDDFAGFMAGQMK